METRLYRLTITCAPDMGQPLLEALCDEFPSVIARDPNMFRTFAEATVELHTSDPNSVAAAVKRLVPESVTNVATS